MSEEAISVRLEPLSVEISVPGGGALLAALADHGIEFPCGGAGLCGGCGVRVLSGTLPITDADRDCFRPEELEQGWRLACQARAEAPLVLECAQWRMPVLTDESRLRASGKRGLGIAIDLGTTTIAAQLLDLATGSVLAVKTLLNPQAVFGGDVMSRIRAALLGADLTALVRDTLRQTVARLAHGREQEVAEVVLVGNTVMHHLFSGCSVEPLAHTPFASPRLGEQRFTARELNWPLSKNCGIRFLRCVGGFVGSDVLAGMVATGIGHAQELTALIDLGTNGEIVVGDCDGILCASTAAGPAFEAGTIRMGMRAVTGAISHVERCGDALAATVIGDGKPRGICGSGLVDAVAVGLAMGAILPSGRITHGAKTLLVRDPVVLYQSDIRDLQLAKGAIAAGLRLLLRRLHADPSSLHSLFLAGAFGNYVRAESAVATGLIEAPVERVRAAGNTALRGAKMLLLSNAEPALPAIEHVNLAAIPGFQSEFAACMAFPQSAAERLQNSIQGQEYSKTGALPQPRSG